MGARQERKWVMGEGPKRPRLVLVGEALGQDEDFQGRAFVGSSGQLLWKLLGYIGVAHEDCYVTNVVKIRPPDNKLHRLHEIGYCVGEFLPQLKSELDSLEGGVIVPLGDTALNAVCRLDSITKWRGSIVQSTLSPRLGRWCVPTVHPRAIQEEWSYWGSVLADFKKALRVERGEFEFPTFNTILRPDFSTVANFCARMLQPEFNPARKFAFDIETNRKTGQIKCVGFGVDTVEGRQSLCIPLKNGIQNYWTEDEEWHIWNILREVFQSNLLKIGQYINFDCTFLQPFIGEISPPWFDMYVAHHTLDPELPHKLAYLTSIYTDIPYYKDSGKDEEETAMTKFTEEELWLYNGKDCESPLLIYPQLVSELKEANLYDFFCGYAQPLARVTWRMQQRGILVSMQERAHLLKVRQRLRKWMEWKLKKLIGHPLNVNSNKQMVEFLYKELKLPLQKDRKSKRPTANKEALEKLEAKTPRMEFRLAIRIRNMVKEVGTYLNAEPSPDGRMRGKYNSCGTETGRSSCKKYYHNTGLDFQNIPPKMRSMFIPGEGRSFVAVDLWQAESIFVTVLSGSEAFKYQLFERKEKLHPLVASWIFNKPPEQISKRAGSFSPNLSEYDIGKRTVHAGSYGLGFRLFALMLKRPEHEAAAFLQRFHDFAPAIKEWHRSVQDQIRHTRTMLNPFGRRRYFRDRIPPPGEEAHIFREGYANNPQGTIADYCHHAQIKLEYTLPLGACIVQEGFDSLIVECADEQIEEVKQLVRWAFDKELTWKGQKFRIPSETETMKRWKK